MNFSKEERILELMDQETFEMNVIGQLQDLNVNESEHTTSLILEVSVSCNHT
jgi:hypothetical protein